MACSPSGLGTHYTNSVRIIPHTGVCVCVCVCVYNLFYLAADEAHSHHVLASLHSSHSCAKGCLEDRKGVCLCVCACGKGLVVKMRSYASLNLIPFLST